MKLRILNTNDTRRALPMRETIEAMKRAYGQLSSGKAIMPLRSRIPVDKYDGVSLFMPALLTQSEDLALKVVSVFPKNQRAGLPLIHALVVAIDSATGRPIALLEGGSLTAIRTGAGSGAATDLLARPDARRVAVFGAGVQARTQLEAICAVRKIESVCIFSLETDRSREFLSDVASQAWAPASIDVANTPNDAISDADVICTATTSSLPVFDGKGLKPGVHINAIGSFTPQMQEIDSETVAKALLVVDSREATLSEAGDLLIPIEEGRISTDHVHAELGEIVNGSRPGRTSEEQITLFKSVGVAVQDAAAAGLALQRAEQLNIGQLINL